MKNSKLLVIALITAISFSLGGCLRIGKPRGNLSDNSQAKRVETEMEKIGKPFGENEAKKVAALRDE